MATQDPLRWDRRYAAETYAFGTEPNDFLVEVASLIPAGRVLCLAEGEGRNAVWLAGEGHEVTAVDASPVGSAKARVLARARGVEIVVGRELEREILEGVYHTGLSAVVQVLARQPGFENRRSG